MSQGAHSIIASLILVQTLSAEELTVTLVATDRGAPPRETHFLFTLILKDVNNFAPQFSQEQYHATTLSIALPDTPLLVVMATDEDYVDNTITYSVQSENFTFNIDDDGVISNVDTFPLVVCYELIDYIFEHKYIYIQSRNVHQLTSCC